MAAYLTPRSTGSAWGVRWSKGLDIYRNRFERIVDNAIEMEDHTSDMRIHQNLIINPEESSAGRIIQYSESLDSLKTGKETNLSVQCARNDHLGHRMAFKSKAVLIAVHMFGS